MTLCTEPAVLNIERGGEVILFSPGDNMIFCLFQIVKSEYASVWAAVDGVRQQKNKALNTKVIPHNALAFRSRCKILN